MFSQDTFSPKGPAVICLLLTLLFTTRCLSDSPESETPTKKPNIIFILADDLGYGDVGCYGGRIATPHIDRLASEGIRFTSGYCSASTCTPTRFSFLTGTYAFRQKGTGVAPPNGPALIQPDTPTLASLLSDADYQTAVIGKWHLGLGGPKGPDWNGVLSPSPLDIGFDHCFLLPTTNDRVPQVFVSGNRVLNLDPSDPLWVGDNKPDENHPTGITHRNSLKMDWSHGHNATIHNGISRIGFYTGGAKARFRDEDLADHWVNESKKWIEENRNRNFFLFFSSHDLHVPRVVHERFQGSSGQGPRGDAIAEFDWSVGELLQTLKELKLENNTLVVLCSDNGPVLDDGYVDQAIEKLGDHDPNGPFRGGKYNVFEGGTRTPFIARWIGNITPQVSDKIICTVDLAATFAHLVNTKLPENGFLDSYDLHDVLLGKADATERPHLIQQDNGQAGNFGYRVGKWKLIRQQSRQATNVELRLTPTKLPLHQLYDLDTDPGETVNVFNEHPELGQKMLKELQEHIDAGRTRTPAEKKDN